MRERTTGMHTHTLAIPMSKQTKGNSRMPCQSHRANNPATVMDT